MTRQSRQLCSRLSDRLGNICRGLMVLGMILLGGASAAGTIYFVGSTISKLLSR